MAGGHGMLGFLSSQQPQTLQGELQGSCFNSLCAFGDVLNYPTEMPISPANRKGILANNLKLAV